MKKSRIGFLLSLSLIFSLFAVATVQAAPPQPVTFTVAAGQTATVRVNVFCLDYNKDFPAGQNIQPNGIANAKQISALSYGVDKGYDQSNPFQLQLALWYLNDNTYHTTGGQNTAVAQEIVTNSNGTNVGQPAVGTTSLLDAVKNNQVTVTATGVQPLNQGDYYGTAVLAVKNNTSNDLNLSIIPGTTFVANGANFQTLVAYATGAQGNAPSQQPTATAAPTTAAPTATTAPATVAGAAATPIPASTPGAALPAAGNGGEAGGNGGTGTFIIAALAVLMVGAWFGLRELNKGRQS